MANETLIEKFPAPIILKKIFLDNLNGRLTIKSSHFLKVLYFQNGKFQLATSTPPHLRLGELLIQSGKLKEGDVITYSRLQERLGSRYRCRLGKLLVQNRLITQRDLYDTLQRQSLLIAVSTFPLASGEWSFNPLASGDETPTDLVFDIPLSRLIIEGTSAIDDFSYYRRRFWSRAPVTLPIPENLGQDLGDDYLRFYMKLMQCRQINTDEAQSVLALDTLAFWRRLLALYLLNVLDFCEFRADLDVEQRMGMLNQLRERLQYNRPGQYEQLRLKDTSMVNDVRERYFSFSRSDTPGSIDAGDMFAGHYGAGGTAGGGYEEFNDAFEILMEQTRSGKSGDAALQSVLHRQVMFSPVSSNVDGAPLAVSGLQPEPRPIIMQPAPVASVQSPPPAVGRNASVPKPYDPPHPAEDAEIPLDLYNKANKSYKDRKYYEAIRFLEKAILMEPSHSAYYLLLGLSQSHIPNLRPQAEKNLLEVTRMEPWNADPLYYLGQLYWLEQLPKKALSYYRKALDVNAGHARAAKMLSRLEKAAPGKKSLFSLFKK